MMARTFHPFLRLPLELQFQVLWHCLVIPEPVNLAYDGHRFVVGGRFLVDDRHFFCILWTCRHLRHHGKRLFLAHNTFVFGDVLFDTDRFDEATRFRTWFWNDNRICTHTRTSTCPHLDWETYVESLSETNVGETLGFWLDLASLRNIRHLIVVSHYYDDRDERILAQTLLFLERLLCAGGELASLFIFMERDMVLELTSPLPPPLADPRLDMLAWSWPLLPALTMLSDQSPRLHMHISTFVHRTTGTHTGPVGPGLCAESAAAARSYLSARALGGGLDGWHLPSGVSMSKIVPVTAFDASDDWRYLLEFGTTELYQLSFRDWEAGQQDVIHRSDLKRALRWDDHRGLLKLERPWLQYELLAVDDGPSSASSTLRSLSSTLQLRLVTDRYRSWYRRFPRIIAQEAEERLLEPDRPDKSYIWSPGDDLWTVTADWASLRIGDSHEPISNSDQEHLHRLLMAMHLFDGASIRGQRRITDYYHVI